MVFVHPPGEEMSAEGLGGGPGFGYTAAEASAPCYLSPDGLQWVSLDPTYSIAVGVVGGLLKGPAQSLSELQAPGIAPEPSKEISTSLLVTCLQPCTPNPFNPRTNIRFALAEPGPVRLRIIDLRGRVVNTLREEQYAAGEHAVTWLGRDHRDRAVASGVYFVQLDVGSDTFSQRIALVR